MKILIWEVSLFCPSSYADLSINLLLGLTKTNDAFLYSSLLTFSPDFSIHKKSLQMLAETAFSVSQSFTCLY